MQKQTPLTVTFHINVSWIKFSSWPRESFLNPKRNGDFSFHVVKQLVSKVRGKILGQTVVCPSSRFMEADRLDRPESRIIASTSNACSHKMA